MIGEPSVLLVAHFFTILYYNYILQETLTVVRNSITTLLQILLIINKRTKVLSSFDCHSQKSHIVDAFQQSHESHKAWCRGNRIRIC